MIWTEDHDVVLREMHAAGHSYAVIARLIGGVSRNACVGRARRIGIPVLTENQRNFRRGPLAKLSKKAGKPVAVKKPPAKISRVPVAPTPPSASSTPSGAGYTLADLPDNGCRYIANDPLTDPRPYCGAPRADHSRTYCAEHHARCHVPTRTSDRPYLPERQMSGARSARPLALSAALGVSS